MSRLLPAGGFHAHGGTLDQDIRCRRHGHRKLSLLLQGAGTVALRRKPPAAQTIVRGTCIFTEAHDDIGPAPRTGNQLWR